MPVPQLGGRDRGLHLRGGSRAKIVREGGGALELEVHFVPVTRSGENPGGSAQGVAVDVDLDVGFNRAVMIPIDGAEAGTQQAAGGSTAIRHDVGLAGNTANSERFIEACLIQGEKRLV